MKPYTYMIDLVRAYENIPFNQLVDDLCAYFDLGTTEAKQLIWRGLRNNEIKMDYNFYLYIESIPS